MGASRRRRPYSLKAITSLTEPFADIAIDPSISDQIDWEVELAVVMASAAPTSSALAGWIMSSATPC
jgi:2-keto-4-pentenoate hydratase/2-oxohepta-3-ene-1,7-dioic acid hydratase in catechol pathway